MADNTDRMLRAIINGQSAMKSELLGEIHKVDKKVDDIKTEMNNGFKKVSDRIDKIGLQVAELDEDAPTSEEFDKLEKRVTKVEAKVASI